MSLWNRWPVSKPKDLIAQVFRVVDFDRNGTTADEYGKVRARSMFKPYGYLKVESPHFGKILRIPIIHRDDFSLATFFFDDLDLIRIKDNQEIELLVTYFPAEADKNGFSISPLHCLHYAVCAHNTINEYYKLSSPDPKSIFGEFVFQGQLTIKDNLNTA